MLLLMLPTLFSLIDKYFMLNVGRIRYLRLQSWNCGSVIYTLLLMIPTPFYLLDKDFMPNFCKHKIFTIPQLKLLKRNVYASSYDSNTLLTTKWGFIVPIYSYVINSGSVTIVCIIFLQSVFSIVPWKYISHDFSAHSYIYLVT